jgi:hypothetical protein
VIKALGAFAFLLFHFRKQDVLDLAELELRITVDGDGLVLFVQLGARRGAFEVVAVADMAPGDVDRVLQGHQIGFGGDVKRRHVVLP